MFLSVVLVCLSPDRRIEPSQYEDIARSIMGKDAYLLFVFDKLILSVSHT